MISLLYNPASNIWVCDSLSPLTLRRGREKNYILYNFILLLRWDMFGVSDMSRNRF